MVVAAVGGAVDFDAASMHLDNALHHRKAEACAGLAGVDIGALEALENTGLIRRR